MLMESITEQQSSGDARVKVLCAEAVEQGRQAKLLHGRDRRTAYQKKGTALSLLVLLGHAEVDSIELKGGQPIVGLTVAGNVQLHVLPSQLTSDAREVVLKQLTTYLNKVLSANPSGDIGLN